MVEYTLMFDPELCLGCYTCEVACKQANDLSVGPRWIRVVTLGPREVGGKLKMDFNAVRCMHCGKPPCVDACPEKAITKRVDGIVLIDLELCNGCKMCIEACPFMAPQYNPDKGIVEKCTLCADLVDRGLKPRCVQHCLSGALQFGDVTELTELMREKKARLRAW